MYKFSIPFRSCHSLKIRLSSSKWLSSLGKLLKNSLYLTNILKSKIRSSRALSLSCAAVWTSAPSSRGQLLKGTCSLNQLVASPSRSLGEAETLGSSNQLYVTIGNKISFMSWKCGHPVVTFKSQLSVLNICTCKKTEGSEPRHRHPHPRPLPEQTSCHCCQRGSLGHAQEPEARNGVLGSSPPPGLQGALCPWPSRFFLSL